VRVGPVSAAWRPRHAAVVLGATTALVLLAATAVGIGDYPMTPLRVLEVLAGLGDDFERVVVLELRMPRVLTGALVGAALGASGAVTQAVARNPLASPDIIGVTAGAGTAAVAVVVLAGSNGTVTGAVAGVGVPAAAMAGGLLAAATVFALAWRRGIDGYRLVLVGIGVGAVLTSLTSWLLVVADLNDAARATVWLTGSLNAASWQHVQPLALGLLVLLPAALLLAAVLGVLQLGDDVARGLGTRVEGGRLAVLVLAVLLASLATAAAGPGAVVALVSPQLARLLCRTARPPLLASAALGAVLVTGSDLVARTALSPTQLPVGIVTAVLGAPYLLWLLTRSRRKVSA
jgi:iron complex transport system permease protein